MPRRYLNVESLDGVVVRCEVLEQDAREYPYALVLRPDTGAVVLVFRLPGDSRTMISAGDPHENRHERDWPILAERLARHANRSK